MIATLVGFGEEMFQHDRRARLTPARADAVPMLVADLFALLLIFVRTGSALMVLPGFAEAYVAAADPAAAGAAGEPRARRAAGARPAGHAGRAARARPAARRRARARPVSRHGGPLRLRRAARRRHRAGLPVGPRGGGDLRPQRGDPGHAAGQPPDHHGAGAAVRHRQPPPAAAGAGGELRRPAGRRSRRRSATWPSCSRGCSARPSRSACGSRRRCSWSAC